ncbi:WUSCHEL-related homeobox 10 [Apostasia shenzhenica]|uniref:WUSCHEL-related homeobox 10 n=1 Tax=Apostasia shenzhenica TaxID=1088818 RepID=A0A2I0B204_9ASPA|nr:WUSCHEL-related homeobox 10 [Apostasia shenzhenica]
MDRRTQEPKYPANGSPAAQPAGSSATGSTRSRWSPKPEQTVILESIFNSGTVNPQKNEIVKIRQLLENFGSIRDSNIFYWFQNRRSRSRSRQRQLQEARSAAAAGGGGALTVSSPESSLASSCLSTLSSSSDTVFINGIRTEVSAEPFDMRSTFGSAVFLIHSSGEVVQVDEYGVLLEGLQVNERYYLVRYIKLSFSFSLSHLF